MRQRGRRLPAATISSAQGVVGDFIVSDWAQGSSFGRAVRVAQLRSIEAGTNADPLQPLFDPVLVRVTTDALVIVGIEICTDESGIPVDFAQSWWVRPIA